MSTTMLRWWRPLHRSNVDSCAVVLKSPLRWWRTVHCSNVPCCRPADSSLLGHKDCSLLYQLPPCRVPSGCYHWTDHSQEGWVQHLTTLANLYWAPWCNRSGLWVFSLSSPRALVSEACGFSSQGICGYGEMNNPNQQVSNRWTSLLLVNKTLEITKTNHNKYGIKAISQIWDQTKG